MERISRRRMLQGTIAAAGAVGVAGALSGCAPTPRLSPDTRPDPTKPEGVDLLPEIEHIVIYMQENHSYDSYFGSLGRGDGFTYGPSGAPTDSNLDADGGTVTVHRAASTCAGAGTSQNWNDTHDQVDGGAMDGFARQSPDSLQYWTADDIPYYHSLADTFVLCDRWFTSCPAQTYPNRRFLQAATSVGLIETDIQKLLNTPDAPNGTIWDRLNDIGVSWNDYAYDLPDIALFPRVLVSNSSRLRSIPDFLHHCATGSLPAVSIVSPGTQSFSEEPPADIRRGEAYTAMLVDAVMTSPDWGSTVMFFMYDEHGGFYDHVPPPPAVPPDSVPPQIHTERGDRPGGFDRYGVRVPAVVISPFARPDYVSHVVHDHTSVLRFIETKWNLGAMTYRDANASDLLDTLDLTTPHFLEPPELVAPAAPTAASTCAPGPALPKH
jgi:phospholipase C